MNMENHWSLRYLKNKRNPMEDKDMAFKSMEGVRPNPKARILDQVREVLRLRHYSLSTEWSYCDWIKRYIQFHGMRSREDLSEGGSKVEMLLSSLAVEVKVAVSTQNQAFNALLFLYREVLHHPNCH